MEAVDQRDLTAEQAAAIATRDVSVALSAGAGCGKTYVLTERYLSHLERELAPSETTDVSHLVAITFTERAAREMRDRIRAKCRERLLSAVDEVETRHWARLVRELESARITTIHAFCAALLRSHAVEAGIDPRFAILEPMHAATLVGELIDHELRKLLRRRAPELVELLLRYDLDRVREMIETLVRERSKLRFDDWLDRSPADLVPRWEAFYRDEALPSALRRVARSPAAFAILEIAADEPPVDDPVMLERCRELARLLPALESCGDPSSMLDEIASHARIGHRKGAPWSDATRETFKNAAEDLRKLARGAKRLVGFDVAAAERAAQTSLDLMRVAAPVLAAYEARKREIGSLDFDDLLMRARDLMCGDGREELRRRTAAGIRLLLVDEFQDTDPAQAELVRALCGDDVTQGKLFFVGDFKQSIYRFRRADPEVFRRLEAEVPPRGQLPLSLNFRSQPAILDFVNALFHDQFQRYQPLRAHREQATPTPAVEFLWVAPEKAQGKVTVAEARKREAEWIARRLRAMLDDERPMVVDRDAEKAEAKDAAPVARPVRQGDIVLLFRAMSDVEHYEAALRRYEIDYYVVGGQAFYAQQEIFDVVNLLRAVECTEDAVSLAGALRSAFFSLADETLFWLSMHGDGLAEGLLAAPTNPRLSCDQRRRAIFAAETLTALRERKDRLPIAELLNEALARTGYDATVLAEFLGERKLANLRKLIDRARSMDRAGIFTLSDFVTELAELVARQPDEALAATHAEKTDVVRLMSIHQSKGLEFPVVVVADIERSTRGPVSPLAVHPTLGPIARLDAAEADDTDMLALFHRVEADHDALERTRLFYVATTRAADYLILSSSVREIDQPQEDWRRLLSTRFDLTTGRLKGPLPEGWAEAAVRVTTSEPLLTKPASRGHGRPRLDRILETAAALRAEGNVVMPTAVGPVEVDRRARRRFSFSSLSGELVTPTTVALHDADEEAESGGGYEGDPLELGTLVHESLAAIDWRDAVDAAAVVARVADRRLVVDDRRLAAARDLIARFASLPRARAISQAKTIQQEIEFLLAWPRGGAADANHLYLQGFIDCLYEDAHGGWHVIDFKTNHVTRDTLANVAAQYELQMYIYALAAERALSSRPAEATLVFLRTGDEHAFRWTQADGERLAAAVDAALTAARRNDLRAASHTIVNDPNVRNSKGNRPNARP